MKCENCGKEFRQDEMTSFEGKEVCKICKVQIIQEQRRVELLNRSKGRKAWNNLTPTQEEFVRKNYYKMSAKEMAAELGITHGLVSYFIKKNRILKPINQVK